VNDNLFGTAQNLLSDAIQETVLTSGISAMDDSPAA
jgi:hypothetical protein